MGAAQGVSWQIPCVSVSHVTLRGTKLSSDTMEVSSSSDDPLMPLLSPLMSLRCPLDVVHISSDVAGMYFVSAVVLMRMNMPIRVSVPLHGARHAVTGAPLHAIQCCKHPKSP